MKMIVISKFSDATRSYSCDVGMDEFIAYLEMQSVKEGYLHVFIDCKNLPF